MIIWINGAFGSGKTQTAYELNKLIENSFVFDPEQCGFFIRSNIPNGIKKSDFQDYQLWRMISNQMLTYIEEQYDGIIICPMTVTNSDYLEEIKTGFESKGIMFKHFCLVADKEVIKKRLKKRGERSSSWAFDQIDRCIKSHKNQYFAEHIDTTHLSIDQVVQEVALRANIKLKADSRSSVKKTFDRLKVWKDNIR